MNQSLSTKLSLSFKKFIFNISRLSLVLSLITIGTSRAMDPSALTEQNTPRRLSITEAPSIGEQPQTNSVLEQLRRLELTPISKPAILNEVMLSSTHQHVNFLKAALREAKKRVIIVSPYISIYRLNEDDDSSFYHDINDATSRGVKVIVFTDVKVDQSRRDNTTPGREQLVKAHVNLRVVNRIHSKNLIIDNTLITFGSFNWLSAVIDPNHNLCNYETSTVIKDENAPILIHRIMNELEIIPLQDHAGYHTFYEEYSPAIGSFSAILSLYDRYRNHPLFGETLINLAYSHLENTLELKEKLTVITWLSTIGQPSPSLVNAIKRIDEFYVGDATEFIKILEVLSPIDSNEARRIASDKQKGILSRISRERDYEHIDWICQFLCKINLENLSEKVEEYFYTGRI